MPTARLPDDPDLEQLRKQAKDLRDLARAGIPGALDLVAEHHPRGAHAVSLAGAQLVVARHYGFPSWPRLKRHVEIIRQYRREPDTVTAADGPAGEFLRLACLRYGDDEPGRWQDARRLLAADPGIAAASIHVAAAACDPGAVRRLLAADPALANRQGGPYRWEPLLYLANARHDPDIAAEPALEAARLLLDHGADPNAGYLWHGMPPPFTALTGVFGCGEGSSLPEHPQAMALASLLLERGADPNDGQALYNRQFGDDDRHLVLLLRYGLGRGDGGPWRARLGRHQDSPRDMVRGLLWWAIVHDQRARVRLLAASGADITSVYTGRTWEPVHDGVTPAGVAAVCGRSELLSYLLSRGVAPPVLSGPDALVAACLQGDHGAVTRLRGHAEAARARRPGLIVWAAASGKHDAIPLLAELGFDVNAQGRADAPTEQPWQTALHHAAGEGDVELARLLLSLGADPGIRDGRFDSTPLGWARHFSQDATAQLLEPLTPED